MSILLTPSALLGFLNEVEELKDKEISFNETEDSIFVTIEGNQYVINGDDAEEIEVDEESFEEVIDVNEEGYAELGEDIEEVTDEGIEGGIIKELVKTLALGGLIKLTKHALENA